MIQIHVTDIPDLNKVMITGMEILSFDMIKHRHGDIMGYLYKNHSRSAYRTNLGGSEVTYSRVDKDGRREKGVMNFPLFLSHTEYRELIEDLEAAQVVFDNLIESTKATTSYTFSIQHGTNNSCAKH